MKVLIESTETLGRIKLELETEEASSYLIAKTINNALNAIGEKDLICIIKSKE